MSSARLIAIVVALVLCASVGTSHAQSLTPDLELETGWYARIKTSMGRIVIRLLPAQAPQSVAHFAAYANGELEWMDPITGELRNDPLFDGVLVQKALAGQRFELGTRRKDGMSFPWRYVPEEGTGPVNFLRDYVVGMTQTDSGRIAAHQFFITSAPQPFLTPGYPCFGEVVHGREVIDMITKVRTYENNDRPIEEVVIEEVRAFTVGNAGELATPEPFWPVQQHLGMREGLRGRKLNPARAPKGDEADQKL